MDGSLEGWEVGCDGMVVEGFDVDGLHVGLLVDGTTVGFDGFDVCGFFVGLVGALCTRFGLKSTRLMVCNRKIMIKIITSIENMDKG